MATVSEPVRMEIKGLMLDPSSNLPIVVLRDPVGERFLPIWIGVFEAQAIALRIEGVESPRPMTHDLLRNSLASLGVEVRKVLISELRDNTFIAEIHLARNGEEVILDSRPSDAIALALRSDAPVFANPSVLERARAIDLDEADEDRLKRWLEEAGPEDFGKYEM